MTDSPEIQALLAWAGDCVGGQVSHAAPLAGGNRRGAWAVDVTRPGGQVLPLFLRFASGPAQPGADPYTLRREAGVYQALAGQPVRIARLHGLHPEREAMLVARVAGQTALRSVPDDVQRRVADDFIDALHELHRIDVHPLDLAGLGSMADVPRLVRRELALWRAMYVEPARPDPLIELALDWLDQHVPITSVTPVLVHGDAGPGNFLFEGSRVSALIDWELAHLGDPIEDLAWLSMRCVLEPFPDFAASIRRYERLDGLPVDRARLAYHRLFVALRVVVIRHRALGQDQPDSDLANSLISRLVNRRLLVASLGQAMGLRQPVDVVGAVEATPRTALFDYAIEQLRHAAADGVDGAALRRVKGAAKALKYLRACDEQGPAFEAAERADLAALLGRPVASVGAGHAALAQAIRAGEVDQAAAWTCLARQNARETALGAATLGALAQRGFPAIDPPVPATA